MSLLKKAAEAEANNAATPETGADTGTASGDAGAAGTATPEASTSTAVAAKATAGALATSRRVNMHVINGLKDALPVDFNTLAPVQANQGKFKDKETDRNLGDTIQIELLSWQDSWVCSPNDTKAPKDLVKYSDDGKTAKDGTDLFEHLAELKAQGFSKAKLSQRLVVVGALLAAEKDQSLVGQLIQIDCATQSRAMFLRYNANAAFKLKMGKLDEESVKLLTLTATAAKGPDNTDYTRIDFKATSEA